MADFCTSFRFIVVVSSDLDNCTAQPVALETKEKIEESAIRLHSPGSHSASSQSPGTVWLCSSYGTGRPSDVVSDIEKYLSSRKGVRGDKVVFLLDEVIDDKSREVAKKLRSTFADSFVWTAGPWPRDKPARFKVGAPLW